jgi:four helix bundle protein
MTNDECRMTNVEPPDIVPSEARVKNYDLEERTAAFAERVIDFALGIRRDAVTTPLISQLVRSATSVGANYCEADDAETKRDFRHKVGLCRKESRETKYWFRMIVRASPSAREEAKVLWQEAKELRLIFSKIRRSATAGTPKKPAK